MNSYGGLQAYQKNKYETASPHRLILMLYEGAIRYMANAKKQIEVSDIEGTNTSIIKSQDIIYELIACLNFDEGKEIAENLSSLYYYVIDLTVKANIEKDVSHLDEAISIIKEIKESWEQIGKEVRV